ncbi:MAG: GNAT family N-acetyltransferase [Kurthia sp.]|nr:GNAT family N-acetyltransferase [Candidatus Kurthia equi]
MDFTIRKMQTEDTKAVRKIAIEGWHNTYESIIPLEIQDDFLEAAYNEKMLIKRAENTNFYVAEREGKILGFANFSSVKKERVVELASIYTLPNEKYKGIGTALIQYAIKDIQPKKIYVSVESLNTVGLKFYEAKNFKIEKEYDDIFNGHVLKTTRMYLDME